MGHFLSFCRNIDKNYLSLESRFFHGFENFTMG